MTAPFYTPDPFAERDFGRLTAFLRNHPFAMLVSIDGDSPMVSHLPLLFDPAGGSQGRLSGHLARANPHWRLLDRGMPALAVFRGPHAYVSPSWYASSAVPTWNYAVVHVKGMPRIVDDKAECTAMLRRMTAAYESRLPDPWEFETGDGRLLDRIVAFEIEVTELQGKFKLSQNRSAEDRRRVIEKLAGSALASEGELARLMEDWQSPPEHPFGS